MESQAELNFEEERLCTRVAKFYYEDELTQQEIARKLGLSRIKVHRILNRAREMGIVEIKIHNPKNDTFIEQEHEIAIRYDLRDVVVVPMPEHGETLYDNLAKGAARWLAGKLEPGIRVGLGLGRTISHLPRYFNVRQKTDCVFMEVVGGSYENSGGIAKYNITSKIAEIAGGRAELLYAPNMVSSPELRQSLISEPGIAEALAHARTCDIVMQSVGTVDETAILFIEDRIGLDQIHSLQDAGAIGDALGHYFDRHGKPVSTFLDDRVIGISLDDLRAIPWSVVVAGGKEKHETLRAALQGNYFSVIITDAETADSLLSAPPLSDR